VNLAPGTDLGVRFRADNTDGTVSNYADSGSVDAPAPPAPPSSNGGPAAPAVSVLATNSANADNGGWLGVLSIVPPASDDGWGVAGVQRTDDPFHVLNDSRLFLDVDRFDPQYYGDILADVEGTTGATYTMTFDSYPPYNGEASTFEHGPVGSPINLTTNGKLPPKLSISLAGSLPNGSPLVSWDMPDGVTSGTVYFYAKVRSNGQETAVKVGPANGVPLDLDPALQEITNMPAGATDIFAVYNGIGDLTYDGSGNEVYQINGWSPYSNDLTVPALGAPHAPASAGAAWVAVNGKPGVVVDWQNTPPNETGFIVERSIDGGKTFTQIGTAKKDDTTFTDNLSNLPSTVKQLQYQVISTNATGQSPPSPIATVGVVRGGPDLTANLNWLIGSVNATFATANTQLVPGNSGLTVATDNLMGALENIEDGWDIAGMRDGNVTTPSETLSETCTVQGGVYDESAVNYFLSGLVEVMMQKYDAEDARLFETLNGYVFLAHLISTDPHDNPREKLAWFRCGVQSAQAGSLAGVPPTYYPLALPNTEGPKPGHFGWHVEGLGTTDPN
jgi:hypothetical protein